MKFLRRLKQDLELAKLQVRHKEMMKTLDDNIENAKTDEERQEAIAFKQRIIDEGIRVRKEAEYNSK